MPQTLKEALASFNRPAAVAEEQAGELTREKIIRRFPRDGWATMPLERYALGQEDSSDSYCRWLEFASRELGSISGGSSVKHAIFKRRQKPGWYFPSDFENEEKAWAAIRASVVTMLDRAAAGRWEELDELVPFQYGPALWLKTLHIYFPQDILPVYSTAHLARFRYRLVGAEQKASRKLGAVELNRRLLTELRDKAELQGFTPGELMRFLYHWDDPREARAIYKIAPGEDARLWDECVKGQYIPVGWPKVGDLGAFEGYAGFLERFRAEYGPEYGDAPAGKATLTRKSKEVWSLTEIRPGDLVLANRGTSRILAVGEVQDPPYEWAGEGNDHPHRIRVKWDEAQARAIPPQQRWAFVTVGPVPLEQYELLLAGQRAGQDTATLPSSPVLDRTLAELGERLEERKQLVLYGPPGTGKTYTARRFLLYWLLSSEGVSAAEVLADAPRARDEWRRLTSAVGDSCPQVTMVTFHPSYGYEDFVEGYRPLEAQDSGLRLGLVDGIFKRVCDSASIQPNKRFVVFIDEINRGNLPRIFGELITVLEADKRESSVVLSQSRRAFSVPGNVYIVGTMNTADRSIKVLDAAIRRRFAFHELMPDSSLLEGRRFGDLSLSDLLDHLNALISRKVGREKQIGHSFFLTDGEPVSDVDEFAKRFRYEVIPLLQEYCYEDYRALADYLGPEIVDAEAQVIQVKVLEQPDALAAALSRVVNGPGHQ